MLKKAMVYLGLGSDEDFEEYDQRRQPDARDERHDRADRADRHLPEHEPVDRIEPARHPANAPTRPRAPITAARPPQSGSVRPLPAKGADEGSASVVRPIPLNPAKPFVMTPVSFNDAQTVGDRFKDKQPVIVNLQRADRDLSRRLIDFASGLCYGLGGKMEKVADQVYLLTPSDVQVSADERKRLREQGLAD
jgi:cell division inhibitor SepF